jgi:cytochrome c biogenesis protein CcdA
LLIIAGIAFYNGFGDITLALKHPGTKYFLIPLMFVAGATLLFGLLYYFPSFSENLVIVTLGSFAFVFGLFSIVMGYYHAEEPEQDVSEVKRDMTCQDHKDPGKK